MYIHSLGFSPLFDLLEDAFVPIGTWDSLNRRLTITHLIVGIFVPASRALRFGSDPKVDSLRIQKSRFRGALLETILDIMMKELFIIHDFD